MQSAYVCMTTHYICVYPVVLRTSVESVVEKFATVSAISCPNVYVCKV